MADNATRDKAGKPTAENLESVLNAVEQEEERLRRAVEAQLRKKAEADATSQLTKEQAKVLPTESRLPFGTEPGSAHEYVKLPTRPASQNLDIRWRIELHGLARGVEPVGLEILGDIVLGRCVGEDDDPDFDLEPYGAFETGVSRRHALLRPTKNCLYIIDLNSTNGTLYNALRVGPGVTRAIGQNDTITLGQFSFTIKIVERPQLLDAGIQPAPATPSRPPDEDGDRPLTPEMLRPTKNGDILVSTSSANQGPE